MNGVNLRVSRAFGHFVMILAGVFLSAMANVSPAIPLPITMKSYRSPSS